MQEKEIWKDTPKTQSGFSGGEIWSDFYFPLCNSVLTPFFKKYIWISSNEVDETGAYYTEWSKPEKTPIQYTNAFIWNLERW